MIHKHKKHVLVGLGLFFIVSMAFAASIIYPSSTPSGQIDGGNMKSVINNISSSCGAGNYLQGFNADGSLICKNIASLATATLSSIQNKYTASGDGLFRKYFNNILNDCGNGRYVRGFNSDKKMICSTQNGDLSIIGLDLNPIPIIHSTLTYPSTTLQANYTQYFSNILGSVCGENEAISGFDTNGHKLGCVSIPQCTYTETLSDGYYVISASNVLCSQGCATPGLPDPNNKCILKIGSKYIAPGFTDILKTNTPCGGSASPCSSSTLSNNGNVMGYCKNGNWGGKNWFFPTYPTSTISYASKLLNEHVGNYWTRHCENCDETTGIKFRLNNSGGSKLSRSEKHYVRCESTTAAPINGLCGTANGSVFPTAPTTNLCNSGTPSAVTGTGPWTWMCNGNNGGDDVWCMANINSPCILDATLDCTL